MIAPEKQTGYKTQRADNDEGGTEHRPCIHAESEHIGVECVQLSGKQEERQDQLKDKLLLLRCHFTWDMIIAETEIPDLENRVLEEIMFLDIKYNVGIYNLLAYVKHLRGQNEEALKSLQKAFRRDHFCHYRRRSGDRYG